MGKFVGFRIQNEEIWEQFKRYVLMKYGKIHTMLALEVEQALKEYLERHASPELNNFKGKVFNIISERKAVSADELIKELNICESNLEKALENLKKERKIVTTKINNRRIAVLADDGTLNILSLPRQEQEWFAVNVFFNIDKGVTYEKIYKFLRTPPAL